MENLQKLIRSNPMRGRNSTAVSESEDCLQVTGSTRPLGGAKYFLLKYVILSSPKIG